MRRLRYVSVAIALVAASVLATNVPARQPAVVEVKVKKYQDLCDLITANKGKVVLLDFWSLTCVPCKRAFPHTVEMEKKLAAQGLVVVSVSTDELKENAQKIQELVLKFLKNNQANFPNIILDEPESLLREKLRLSSLPCIYVFNREGKWRQFIGDDLLPDPNSGKYPGMEAYVKYCLEQPAPK
jgi:thiol-disulfide isomerase/thioredoxin